MNTPEQEIENVLRRAPQPKPPADLKNRLIAQVQLPAARPASQPALTVRSRGGWLRRWWPALAPAAVSVACAAVLTVQQSQIRDLRETIQTLAQAAAATEAASSTPTARTDSGASASGSSVTEQQEIDRLKKLASQLAADMAQLEQMRAENANLRAELAKPAATLPPEFKDAQEAMAKAREKAQTIACVNNLKQVGLAFRIWAGDNNDRFPACVPINEGGATGSDSADRIFLVMSNELSTPKLLVCPADTNRTAAPNWASFTSANCSYQYVGGTASETEPDAVLVTCPIHGNVLLADGSVQQGVAKSHPEWLVPRDGKLYLDMGRVPPPAPPARGRNPEIDALKQSIEQYGQGQNGQPAPARPGAGRRGGPPGDPNQ